LVCCLVVGFASECAVVPEDLVGVDGVGELLGVDGALTVGNYYDRRGHLVLSDGLGITV
jgi:hypothetical protein